MDSKDKDHTSQKDDRPSPADFELYLPWACNQMSVETMVIITKVLQQEYTSISGTSDKKVKKKSRAQSELELGSDQKPDNRNLVSSMSKDEYVNILAVYDSNDNLVQLKFINNLKIPRTVMKVIGMIIHYQNYLTNITINKGMDEHTLYEVYKFLPQSYITDLCLDNAYLKQGNYYIILETPNSIRQLSLARCSITDDVVKTLADVLAYPQPSSKTLSILNLSSNRITDVGAKFLSESLRSNRQLMYLNLADNMLTDDGVGDILSILGPFPLTSEELVLSRARRFAYLKEKNDLINRIGQELRAGDFEKKPAKRKSMKQSPISKKKGIDKEASLKSMLEPKSLTNFDQVLMEKATEIAVNTLGEFSDPYDKANTFVENEVVHCCGNNALCYLNVSYNDFSYLSLKMLADVLSYQRRVDRKPRGLVKVLIEGNLLPVQCKELDVIDQILAMNLSEQSRLSSVSKKKVLGKVGSK